MRLDRSPGEGGGFIGFPVSIGPLRGAGVGAPHAGHSAQKSQSLAHASGLVQLAFTTQVLQASLVPAQN